MRKDQGSGTEIDGVNERHDACGMKLDVAQCIKSEED